jgi:hypothetical protein
LNRPAAGKNTVENFVGCAIAAHRKKTPVTLIVGFPRKLNGMSLASGRDNVNLQALLTKPREGWSGKLRRAAAAGGRVDDGKEAIRLRLERFQYVDPCSTKIFSADFTKAESRLRCPVLPDAPPEHFF